MRRVRVARSREDALTRPGASRSVARSTAARSTAQRTIDDPASLHAADTGTRIEQTLALQRSAGNAAVGQVTHRGGAPGGRSVVATGHAQTLTVRDAPGGVQQVRDQTKDFSFARTQTLLEADPPLFSATTEAGKDGYVAKVRRVSTRPPDHIVDVPAEGRHDLGPYGKKGRRFVEIDATWAGKFKTGEQEHVDDTTLAWAETWKVIVAAINEVAGAKAAPAASADAATTDAWKRVTAKLPAWLRPKDPSEAAQRAVWTATKGSGTNVRKMISASGRFRDDQGWHTPDKIKKDDAPKDDLVEVVADGKSKIGSIKPREVIDLAIKELQAAGQP